MLPDGRSVMSTAFFLGLGLRDHKISQTQCFTGGDITQKIACKDCLQTYHKKSKGLYVHQHFIVRITNPFPTTRVTGNSRPFFQPSPTGSGTFEPRGSSSKKNTVSKHGMRLGLYFGVCTTCVVSVKQRGLPRLSVYVATNKIG